MRISLLSDEKAIKILRVLKKGGKITSYCTGRSGFPTLWTSKGDDSGVTVYDTDISELIRFGFVDQDLIYSDFKEDWGGFAPLVQRSSFLGTSYTISGRGKEFLRKNG